jgi:hypothetical protein
MDRYSAMAQPWYAVLQAIEQLTVLRVIASPDWVHNRVVAPAGFRPNAEFAAPCPGQK